MYLTIKATDTIWLKYDLLSVYVIISSISNHCKRSADLSFVTHPRLTSHACLSKQTTDLAVFLKASARFTMNEQGNRKFINQCHLKIRNVLLCGLRPGRCLVGVMVVRDLFVMAAIRELTVITFFVNQVQVDSAWIYRG